MKEKSKKIIFGYLPGFILGLISACTISVIAATYFPSNQTTYDNTNTELKSENVQDAIDELYGVCFPSAADQIIEDAGLEKDPYECRYFFTGATPNNYITFNGEDAGWRIISVECDGTIKIMKNESIVDKQWDSRGYDDWTTASLNTYLNEEYMNTFTSIVKSQIIEKDFSIGAVSRESTNLANTINNENNEKWTGKIALPTASEYIRSNSDKNNCGTMKQLYNSTTCDETSWMHNNNFWWLLSPAAGYYSYVVGVYSHGSIYYNHTGNNSAVRPALYLNSNVTLSGSGTQSEPYVVS